MSMWWILIAFSLTWVGFTYAGYPLLLLILRRLSPRPISAGDAFPPISIIIAVRNGEHALARKLDDTLALAYPGRVEVIVASDASTDRTDAIAESMAGRGVQLVRREEHLGKEAAQAAAIERASGQILVFTDVTAALEPDALRRVVRPFADPAVGCVSSEDVVESEGGEGVYVRFEMALRRWESEVSSLVGLSGSLFAARRELCSPWPHDLASDFRTALEAVRRGFRAISEPSARARFRASDDAAAEWRRKVRTVRRGIAVLVAYRDLLHPRFGRTALSLWGHKLTRFTSPFALIALLVGSMAAAPASGWASALLVVQGAFYAAGCLALVASSLQALLPLRLASFFLVVNASMLVAWAYHLSGRRAVTWQPTRR